MIDRTLLTEALADFEGGPIAPHRNQTIVDALRLLLDFPTVEAVTAFVRATGNVLGYEAVAGLEAVRDTMIGDTDD